MKRKTRFFTRARNRFIALVLMLTLILTTVVTTDSALKTETSAVAPVLVAVGTVAVSAIFGDVVTSVFDDVTCFLTSWFQWPPRPQLGHKMSDWRTVVNVTCSQYGKQVRTCNNSNCRQEETRPLIPPGHLMTGWQETTAPSCVSTGISNDFCRHSGCGLQETRILPSTGHFLSGWFITTQPTTQSIGTETRRCSNTNCQHNETRELPMLPLLAISTESWNLSSTANNTSVLVTSNLAWSVSSDSRWLTVSTTSGTNSANITLAATDNTSPTERYATVTITGGGITRSISIVQECDECLRNGHSGGNVVCGVPQSCTRCNVQIAAAVDCLPGRPATCSTGQQCVRCSAELNPALGCLPNSETLCRVANNCVRCNLEVLPATDCGVCEICVPLTGCAIGDHNFRINPRCNVDACRRADCDIVFFCNNDNCVECGYIETEIICDICGTKESEDCTRCHDCRRTLANCLCRCSGCGRLIRNCNCSLPEIPCDECGEVECECCKCLVICDCGECFNCSDCFCPEEIPSTPNNRGCDCQNCYDCGFRGGRFGFGCVTGGERPSVGDALAVLRFLVGLSSPIFDCDDARAAATIMNPVADSPTMADALQILRYAVNLHNAITNP